MFSQKKSTCLVVEPLCLNSIFKINVLHYFILMNNHLEIYLKEDKHSIYYGRK